MVFIVFFISCQSSKDHKFRVQKENNYIGLGFSKEVNRLHEKGVDSIITCYRGFYGGMRGWDRIFSNGYVFYKKSNKVFMRRIKKNGDVSEYRRCKDVFRYYDKNQVDICSNDVKIVDSLCFMHYRYSQIDLYINSVNLSTFEINYDGQYFEENESNKRYLWFLIIEKVIFQFEDELIWN
jgi:hypothetical protein